MDAGLVVNSKYEILEKLDAGGMGTVLKVKNLEDGKFYALKYCNEKDEAGLRRFAREVRIMIDTKHPNIVSILDSDLLNSPPYFIMPLAVTSLSKMIPDFKDDINKVLELFLEICKGISALHLAGKYHRDIKPNNVLLMEDGQIVISDFGLSKVIVTESSTHMSSEHFLGTISYYAPEQVIAKNSDVRTDVYQLGKTLYEMITGLNPYLVDPSLLSPGINHIVSKALARKPEDRYQSVNDLQQAIYTYKLSLDPNSNPQDAFNNKLSEVKDLLDKGEYKKEECITLLDCLNKFKDDTNKFIEQFDRIPSPILKVYAKQLAVEFESSLRLYTTHIEEYLRMNNLDFSYADVIASKMSTIFYSSGDIEFKKIAILNTMKAAIMFNRFHAMDVFNNFLLSIKTNDDAIIVSEFLKTEIEWYKDLYSQVIKSDLNYYLQSAWEVADKYLKEKRVKSAFLPPF